MSNSPAISDHNDNYNQDGILGTHPPRFSTGEVLKLASNLYGLDGTINFFDSERD